MGEISPIFRSLFFSGTLSAGDWSYLFPENIAEFAFPPHWPFIWITPLYQLTAKIFVQYFGLSWELTERVVWFFPFFILTIFSSWFLAKTLFPKSKIIQFLAPLIFLLNTYILMVVGGGQMGVAMAYALAPLVLGLLLEKRMLLMGLAFGAELMFDPRLALIVLLAAILLVIFLKINFKKFVVAGLIAGIFNAFWLIPTVFKVQDIFPFGYTSAAGFRFLSMANFSQTLSLLHPNWPENIFGKTSLLKPEFLILPILAYLALLFKPTKPVLAFSLLGLVGAFLAKGVNPPAGLINLWLFNHVPGFNLFRDPTKFYILAALSYSLLIPLSIVEIYRRLGPAAKIFLLLVIGYLLFLVRPVWLGQLSGTFVSRPVPNDYLVLKDFLTADQSFGRVLWLPRRQRFGFYSNRHPALELEQFMADDKCLAPFCDLKMAGLNRGYFGCFPNERCFPVDASFLANPLLASVMKSLSIKYLVIPFDSEGEIFLRERMYDDSSRQKLVDFVNSLNYLRPVNLSGKINFYEVGQ